MTNFVKLLISILTALQLSACVTQQYGNEDKLIIQNDATQNEIAMTRISLGLGYLKMGNTTQAKLNLEKAKRFAPKLVQVHTAFAHYYDTVGELDLAISAYEEALSIDDQDADTLNNYGVFLCRQDRLDEAESQFLKAIAIPTYLLVSESYENLALCQLKKSRFIKGEEYLSKAIKHNPSSASALLEMARLQYIKADYQQAHAYIKRYEKSTRRFTPTALALSFKVFEKLSDKKTAKNYASMLVKMFPGSYEAKQYLLTGLTEIEADRLAVLYQQANKTKSKKRVVVLSPKKTELPKNQSTHNNIVKEKTVDKHLIKQASSKDVTHEFDPSQSKVVKQTATQKAFKLPVHIIKKGDSLYNISVKYNIQMASLLNWNNISKSKVLYIGDVIYLTNPRMATN
jgi:type IV pilus assembly protein PilF